MDEYSVLDMINSNGLKSLLSAAFGAAGLKLVEMYISYRSQKEGNQQEDDTNIRQELWADRKVMLQQVADTEKEAIEWREKYYLALSQVMMLRTAMQLREGTDEVPIELSNDVMIGSPPGITFVETITSTLSRFCSKCDGIPGKTTCPNCNGTGFVSAK